VARIDRLRPFAHVIASAGVPLVDVVLLEGATLAS